MIANLEKDKEFMEALKNWVAPEDSGWEFEIIAEKSRLKIADRKVNMAIVLVMINQKDGNHHAEILRIWRDLNDKFAISCEMQQDCQREDEVILEDMFTTLTRLIPIEAL